MKTYVRTYKYLLTYAQISKLHRVKHFMIATASFMNETMVNIVLWKY